jgi:hypothetical protein
MLKKKFFIILFALFVAIVFVSSNLLARGNVPGPVVYVVEQDLFYDAIIAADPLPMKGPFQLLYLCEVDGVEGLCTDYGPGDFGYVGGRWWVDEDGNGEMNEGDHFFSCPLLGPGRENP